MSPPGPEAGDVFSVAKADDMVRLTVKTPTSETDMDMPPIAAVWLATELLQAAGLDGASRLVSVLAYRQWGQPETAGEPS